MHHFPSRTAFTLVELSIVLVILGLLIGGVLTGQSLIRAAELRSITTQYNQFVTATQTFRDKYLGLPGDLQNAQSYWGVAHATPATCITTIGTGAQTCNGDGNGMVSHSGSTSNESFRYWQHLANAGLIEGSYTGVQAAALSPSATNVNSPPGKISSTLWFPHFWGMLSGGGSYFDGNYGNTLVFSGITSNNFPSTPALKPEEAYNIDMKIDDGKPAVGKAVIRDGNGFTGTGCTTATSSTQTSASYNLSNAAVSCGFYFIQAF